MKVFIQIVCLVFIQCSIGLGQSNIYKIESGMVAFTSDAPLELIKAQTENILGLLDVDARTFAFSIKVNTFEGFNNPLQQIHFNENYLESIRFPVATFKGKIIEQRDLTEEGKFSIRAKGIFNIHGKEQERIIKCNLVVKDDVIQVASNFSLLLLEHDISIPKIVQQKIAEKIFIDVDLVLKKK